MRGSPCPLYIWHLDAGQIVLEARSFPSPVGLCVFTFLSTGNAAVALPEHAAEATHALGIPPTVVALPSLGNTQTKVSIT